MTDLEQVQSELAHHGILGMKWGIRRYQNSDGSLTTAGKKKVSSYDKRIKNAKEDIKQAKKENVDVKKSGMNSQTVRNLYKVDEANRKTAEFFGESYTSALPKVAVKMDAKGNIKDIYGLNHYEVQSFLDGVVSDNRSTIAYSEKVIARLEKKKASLVGA